MKGKYQVLVLNADYTFLNVVSVQRAFLYISKGKVQVEKYTDKSISTSEDIFQIPKIVRFIKFVRQIFKKKIPWSKRNVIFRDRGVCQYCGSTSGKMTVDHITPKVLGGKNTFENTVCACFSCNNKKGSLSLKEVGLFLKRRPVHPTVSEFVMKLAKNLKLDNFIDELVNQ